MRLTLDITSISREISRENSREVFLQCVSEAMASLSDVVGIIDMDGFTIEKEFYCKELGILKVGDFAAHSYFFDIGVNWLDLLAKDRTSCPFVMKHIHRLPFWRAIRSLGSAFRYSGKYCR